MKPARIVLFSLPLALFFFSEIHAYDARPRCFKELEKDFFETELVMLALEYYKVPQGSWTLITRGLQSNAGNLSGKVWAEGRKMRPNPLDYPFDPKESTRLLRTLTHEIFRSTVVRYPMNRNVEWESMFNYIFDVQRQRLEKCLNETRKPAN